MSYCKAPVTALIEQRGIYDGKCGFNNNVGYHTQLNGAVIASKATADKNHLETGTLGNEVDYKVSHVRISTGTRNDGSNR